MDREPMRAAAPPVPPHRDPGDLGALPLISAVCRRSAVLVNGGHRDCADVWAQPHALARAGATLLRYLRTVTCGR